MATAPVVETVNITINDVELAVPKGELIVESVKRLGLEIPIFCYHSRLKPVGMCRMCLVEVGFRQPDGSVRKMPKPQAGCTLPASEGMAVYSDSEMVHRDRKGVLEFLLINHPLDCPICDRGGECPLQNNTLFYGPSTTRFLQMKRHALKAFPLSKFVTLDLERCIQCGRCVRFTEEISGDADLAFRFRASEMQPSTFELKEFKSKFSGNVIEICPVGALTSGQYRFRARPWDLETSPAICTVCSNGCSVWFDHRVGQFVRINARTNEAINEEWTCDRGKFGHDFYNSEKRLRTPLIRKGGRFVESSWAEAYERILEAFRAGGNRIGALATPTFSNEGIYLFQKFFRGTLKSNNVDCRWTRTLQRAEDRLERTMRVNQVQTKIVDLESKQAILIFGSELSDEEPIVFLRIRKAWSQFGTQVIVASDQPNDADAFGTVILRYKPGTANVLASGLLNLLVNAGRAQVPDATKKALEPYSEAFVESETGISISSLRDAAALLDGAAIVTTQSLFDDERAQDIIEALAGIAITTQGEFNLYALDSNGQGAVDLGLLPDVLPGGGLVSDEAARKKVEAESEASNPAEAGLGTQKMIEAAAAERLEALWLVNCDPLELLGHSPLAQRALENVPFLVYQGELETPAMAYASVVLPMAAPAEQDGSYTNVEGTVQRMKPAIPPPGDAKPSWRIFSEASMRAEPMTPYFNAGEVMDEIARVVPSYASARYTLMGGGRSELDPDTPVEAEAVSVAVPE